MVPINSRIKFTRHSPYRRVMCIHSVRYLRYSPRFKRSIRWDVTGLGLDQRSLAFNHMTGKSFKTVEIKLRVEFTKSC
jgi:hypothetical protein